jgi:hypothetical protein
MGKKLHESDRFAIAGHLVPDELAPLDPHAGGSVARLIRHFLPLSPTHRSELLAVAASLPQQHRVAPARLPSGYYGLLNSPGPGGVVLRLLGNRNLGLGAVAKAVYEITEGGHYWAASTYGLVGTGRKDLTPDLLGDLAVLVDIPAAEIEALTGVAVTGKPDAEVGDRVWECRRLTTDQINTLHEVAEALPQAR